MLGTTECCVNCKKGTFSSRMMQDDLQSVLRSLSTLMFIPTRWNANRCYSLKTTSLIFEAFQILFPTASFIFTAAKVVSSGDMRKNEAESFDPLRIHNGGCSETLKLLHVISCEMFTFFDDLKTNQKTERNSRECAVRTGNQL